MKKYFIAYQTLWNGKNELFNGIYQFPFNIMKSEDTLHRAESIIAKKEYGDERNITILNIIKVK